MPSKLYCATFDSRDPAFLANFWAQALGYQVVYSSAEEVAVAKDENTWPGLIFMRVPEEKQVKNRVHLDLNPDDQDAEVQRLLGLGASRVDIGQRDVRWVVLADPEGNEFCVLTPHSDQA